MLARDNTADLPAFRNITRLYYKEIRYRPPYPPIRVVTKIFVFVISRKFSQNFNFVFREIFAKHEIKIWTKFP